MKQTCLAVCSDHVVSHVESALLDVSYVENISTVHLNVNDFKFCLAVNDDSTSVCLLTTRFSVKVRSVKDESQKLSCG